MRLGYRYGEKKVVHVNRALSFSYGIDALVFKNYYTIKHYESRCVLIFNSTKI